MTTNLERNLLAPDTLDAHQGELVQHLPEMVAGANERAFIEQILIPQFRDALNRVLEDFEGSRESADCPLTPREIDQLCGSVDAMVINNAELLDTNGLFKPVLKLIDTVRKRIRTELLEDFYGYGRALLAQYGVTDRAGLLKKGAYWFMRAEFPPFGKGKAFARAVLGKALRRISVKDLEEIADRLGFIPEPREEEILVAYRMALAEYGVEDHASLLGKGVDWFRYTEFPHFGKGKALGAKILGQPLKGISVKILEEIADRLGFVEIAQERLVAFRTALASHGVVDRFGLLKMGPTLFRKTDFSPFGKGIAFAKLITGKTPRFITSEILEEIADRLGFVEIAQERLVAFRTALASHGVVDRFGLLKMGPTLFRKTDFSPFGKGIAFAKLITGKTPRFITPEILEEIADRLGFAVESEEQKLRSYRAALAVHGVTDRASLLRMGSHEFTRTDFPGFGKGKAFAVIIMGNTLGHNISLQVLGKIADKLGW